MQSLSHVYYTHQTHILTIIVKYGDLCRVWSQTHTGNWSSGERESCIERLGEFKNSVTNDSDWNFNSGVDKVKCKQQICNANIVISICKTIIP